MALSDILSPTAGLVGNSFSKIGKLAWILIPIVVIGGVIALIFILKKIKDKKNQWTHKLKVRRVLQNNLLSEPFYHKMRRFPLIKKAEVFELEKPLLGIYLLPELEEYSDVNEYSIIIDKNNRIYTNKGEYFNPDKNSALVSAKHSEIDIQRQNLKADFQDINKINKRIEWAQIAKYAFMTMGIIALLIIGIVAIQEWGKASENKAQEAQATAVMMTQLNEAMQTMQATVNTQKLEILPLLKEIYGTENLAPYINSKVILNEKIEG